ncbi:MAG: FkbM family methyltransferase [Pelobium sp.]
MMKAFLKQIIPNHWKQNWRRSLGVPDQESSFTRLKNLGFKPQIILDIGAYEGHWAQLFLKEFPESKIMMLEGQEQKETFLSPLCQSNPSLHYQIALLGSKEEEVTFHIYETASSVLSENNETGAILQTRMLKRLDLIVENTLFAVPDFIKIDTQGYELEILKGGLKTLKHAQAVLLEVSLLPIYQNCPLVDEVIIFMKDQGFALYDICSLMRRPLDQALFQSDFLFVRNDSFLRGNLKWA